MRRRPEQARVALVRPSRRGSGG
uniref:Uncharacterized protein n=1 Tax=Arundo donax TaxID=35708 RepID=A0A0A9G466_ARUDO